VDRIWLSAHSGAGVDQLLAALHARLGTDLHHCLLRLPAGEGRARARLHAAGAVLRQRGLEDGGVELEVSLRRHDLERICREAGIELPEVIAPGVSPCAGGDRFIQSPVPETPRVDA
jgi:GTP-binding protein HflX